MEWARRLRWVIPVLVFGMVVMASQIAYAAASVLTSIDFSPSRAGIIGVNPITNKIYVSRDDAPQGINVINANTNAILTTVPGLGFHVGLSVNASTNRIYVSQQFSSSVRVIDGSNDSVVTDIPIPSTQTVGFNALDPGLNRLYVIRPNDGDIAVVDTTTNTLIGPVAPGCCDQGSALVVDPQTHRVYVVNFTSGNVVVLDGNNPTLPTLATIPLSAAGVRAAVHVSTHRVYVTIPTQNKVSIIDGQPGSPTENTVVGSITVGTSPVGVAVDGNRNRVYVTNQGSQSLSIIDTPVNGVVDTVAGVPNGSGSVALLPSLRRIYASDDGQRRVTVVVDPLPLSGGRDFSIDSEPTGRLMAWQGGSTQTGYTLLRIPISGGTSAMTPLAGSATSFTDTTAMLPGSMLFYVLLPNDESGNILGTSDVLGAITGLRTPTRAPTNFKLELNQSTTAKLTWGPPSTGDQFAYCLFAIPLNGGPQRTTCVPANATMTTDATGGHPTCYLLVALFVNGSSNTDANCGIPSLATLSSAQAPSAQAATARTSSVDTSQRGTARTTSRRPSADQVTASVQQAVKPRDVQQVIERAKASANDPKIRNRGPGNR